MGGKRQRKTAKAAKGGHGTSRRRQKIVAPPVDPLPEPEPEPEPDAQIRKQLGTLQQRRRKWAIDRTMRQLERRQRDPKPLTNELADSLAAFNFMPRRGAMPGPLPRRYRETPVFRWFLSLDHADKCATLTVHARQWVRTLLHMYRLHAKQGPLRFLVLPDLIPRSHGSVEDGITYRRSSVHLIPAT